MILMKLTNIKFISSGTYKLLSRNQENLDDMKHFLNAEWEKKTSRCQRVYSKQNFNYRKKWNVRWENLNDKKS